MVTQPVCAHWNPVSGNAVIAARYPACWFNNFYLLLDACGPVAEAGATVSEDTQPRDSWLADCIIALLTFVWCLGVVVSVTFPAIPLPFQGHVSPSFKCMFHGALADQFVPSVCEVMLIE